MREWTLALGRRPMRLFYSGTHGSICVNCDEYVAGELFHIPCFGQCGACPTMPHCVERKGNEAIFPATYGHADEAEGWWVEHFVRGHMSGLDGLEAAREMAIRAEDYYAATGREYPLPKVDRS